ncbi:YkvA family protein [Pseudoneobacillus sp. C159]
MEKEDFYQSFRRRMQEWKISEDGKINKFADILMFGPDLFHLLCKLTVDENVSVADKAKLAAAIAYFVSPVDLIPEALTGPVGYVDDVAIAAYVLNGIINNSSPEIVQKHWAGDEDVLKVIKQILEVADNMVGTGLWKILKGKFGY